MFHWDEAMIGTSRCFLQVKGKIPLLSRSKSAVLISGETGTGKELFARAIHSSGERGEKPFVHVNCAALSAQMLENELSGGSKGPCTGALVEKAGLFHEAGGGTVFLDEINRLSMAVQRKLLRVLQDQDLRPPGSTKSRSIDVKIVAATSTDLRGLVEAHRFLEDLFHRLNMLSVVLPSLRSRKEDIPELARHFVAHAAEALGKRTVRLSPGAIEALIHYEWPGNVRELQGVVHRAVAMAPTEVIEPMDLDLPVQEGLRSAITVVQGMMVDGSGGFQAMKAKVVDEFERTYLSQILSAHQGNVSQAARAAKKERRAFQRLLQKHGLRRRDLSAAC